MPTLAGRGVIQRHDQFMAGSRGGRRASRSEQTQVKSSNCAFCFAQNAGIYVVKLVVARDLACNLSMDFVKQG